MSISPASGGASYPSPGPNGGSAVAVLAVAMACGVLTGYFTNWDTGITVFLAIISLFKPDR